MRPVRAVLFTKPFELLLAACLFVLGVVMILSPTVLEHTPISFETRGVIHHLWHYSLIAGGALTLFGLLWDRPRLALRIELVGLCVMWVAIAENLIAVVTDGRPVSGMLLATRVAILSWLVVRAYALLTQPVLYVVRGEGRR